MYRHVLVPTDGSEHSRRAAEYARRIAERDGARLTILTTIREVDTGELDNLGIDGPEALLAAEERRQGGARLEETAQHVADGSIDVATAIVSGEPHREICDYAESHDVDLIVMCTVGRTSLADYLFGTTTQRVASQCSVPVMVV